MSERFWLHDRKRPLYERLWARVEVCDSGCWNWTGARQRTSLRYGIIRIANGNALVHRLAFMMTRGSIAAGLFVCHRCDNPICVNPDHLFVGTVADNNRDRDRKGRTGAARGARSPYKLYPERYHKGESTPTSKLTATQVAELRDLRRGGMKYEDLATRFEISKTQVARIVRGDSWKAAT